MKYADIEQIITNIEHKEKALRILTELKDTVTDRTEADGKVDVKIDNKVFRIEATELQKLIDKEVLTTDTTADFAELKTKVK